jgi:hypothetical protein
VIALVYVPDVCCPGASRAEVSGHQENAGRYHDPAPSRNVVGAGEAIGPRLRPLPMDLCNQTCTTERGRRRPRARPPTGACPGGHRRRSDPPWAVARSPGRHPRRQAWRSGSDEQGGPFLFCARPGVVTAPACAQCRGDRGPRAACAHAPGIDHHGCDVLWAHGPVRTPSLLAVARPSLHAARSACPASRP